MNMLNYYGQNVPMYGQNVETSRLHQRQHPTFKLLRWGSCCCRTVCTLRANHWAGCLVPCPANARVKRAALASQRSKHVLVHVGSPGVRALQADHTRSGICGACCPPAGAEFCNAAGVQAL